MALVAVAFGEAIVSSLRQTRPLPWRVNCVERIAGEGMPGASTARLGDPEGSFCAVVDSPTAPFDRSFTALRSSQRYGTWAGEVSSDTQMKSGSVDA